MYILSYFRFYKLILNSFESRNKARITKKGAMGERKLARTE